MDHGQIKPNSQTPLDLVPGKREGFSFTWAVRCEIETPQGTKIELVVPANETVYITKSEGPDDIEVRFLIVDELKPSGPKLVRNTE